MSQTTIETSYLPALLMPRAKDSEPETTPAPKAESAEPPVGHTIDELAARTGVASRTIRFYQAKGILEKPRRMGRKALYTDEHIARLELIAKLQDRGLRIRGMRQLLARRDSDTAVSEWLGLSEKLSEPWSKERARAVDEVEMTQCIGDRPPGTLAAVVRAGLAERRDDPPKTYIIPSPSLLEIALRLLDSGISLEVTTMLEPILRKGLHQAAEGVVDTFLEQGGLDRPGDEARLTAALDALRVQGANAVSIIFAQEIERTLGALLESGPPSRRRRGRR